MANSVKFVVEWTSTDEDGFFHQTQEFNAKVVAIEFGKSLLRKPNMYNVSIYEVNQAKTEIPLTEWNPAIQSRDEALNELDYETEYVVEYRRAELGDKYTRSYKTLNDAKRTYEMLEQAGGDVKDLKLCIVHKRTVFNKERPKKRTLYIPIIINEDETIYDVGIALTRDSAERALNDSWDLMSPSKRAKAIKKIQEVEIDLWK